jgi:hypothetical protein
VRVVLTLLAGAAIAAVFALPAGAATYTLTCPTADDACKALAERLEAQVAATEANGAKLDQLHTDLTTTGGATEVAGTVALSDDDASRLDLVWWGVWINSGFLLVLIAAPIWERAWRFWRE